MRHCEGCGKKCKKRKLGTYYGRFGKVKLCYKCLLVTLEDYRNGYH